MNEFLFWTYISSIVIYILVILIIFLAWRHFFPRKILLFLTLTFITSSLSFLVLLFSELTAPYSKEFFLNPYLYLIYLSLVGCAMYTIYLLVLETQFKDNLFLQILGYILLSGIPIYSILSSVSLSLVKFRDYFWYYQDLLIGCAYGIGFLAYVLFAIGCFRDSKSDRLEWEHQRGFILLGIYGIGIAFGLSLISWGLVLNDFSTPPDPLISAFWLIWIDIVVVLFLFIVKRVMNLISK